MDPQKKWIQKKRVACKFLQELPRDVHNYAGEELSPFTFSGENVSSCNDILMDLKDCGKCKNELCCQSSLTGSPPPFLERGGGFWAGRGGGGNLGLSPARLNAKL